MMEPVVSRQNILTAYNRVVRNAGAAGVDGILVGELDGNCNEQWETIRQELLEGSYRPQPVRGSDTEMTGPAAILSARRALILENRCFVGRPYGQVVVRLTILQRDAFPRRDATRSDRHGATVCRVWWHCATQIHCVFALLGTTDQNSYNSTIGAGGANPASCSNPGERQSFYIR